MHLNDGFWIEAIVSKPDGWLQRVVSARRKKRGGWNKVSSKRRKGLHGLGKYDAGYLSVFWRLLTCAPSLAFDSRSLVFSSNRFTPLRQQNVPSLPCRRVLQQLKTENTETRTLCCC